MKNKALELTIKIAGKMDKSLTTSIQNTQSTLAKLGTTMEKVGSAGLKVMGALAVGTAKVLNDCVSEAQKLESQMAPVTRYVSGLTDQYGKVSDAMTENGKTAKENYEAMKKYIQDLSTQVPRTTEQIATMSAALGQSGKTAKIQLSTTILRDTAVAATAMDLDDDTAGQYMAKWEEAYNFSHEQVMELMDQINYLGANYATTAAEIAQSVNDAGSMGQIAGVDPAATAALAASMQAMGVDAARVGTSVTRIYTNLSKGSSATKAQKEMWAELGFTAQGIAKSMQADGTGTLLKVFEAIGNLPSERKVAALNTLFGQWAIQGGAKVTQNVDLLTQMLNDVQNAGKYSGSMETEFLIESGTGENLDQMMKNAVVALQQDVGTAFLPAKKQFAAAFNDFTNSIRDMPELSKLSDSLGKLAVNGIAALSDALEKALPHIQAGLDYLSEHGGEVAAALKKLVLGFAGLKLGGGVLSTAGNAGNIVSAVSGVIGGEKTTAKGKKKASGGVSLTSLWNTIQNHKNDNGGLKNTLRLTAAGLLGGNGLKGTQDMLKQTAANPGLLSSMTGKGNLASGLTSRFQASKAGQALSGVGARLSGLKNSVANTKAGSAVFSIAGKAAGKTASVASVTKNGLVSIPGKIAGSAPVQAAKKIGSGALGKAAGAATAVKNSALGQIAGSYGGVISSLLSPAAGAFGGIFAHAAPVIGVISSIIAVVSLLGDHLEDIRGIVGNVFGEKGLAVFDGFVEKLRTVKNFIGGLFEDGGVANLLAPIRDGFAGLLSGGGFLSTLFGGEETGLAAFDGVVTILQSIMGVVGQVVDFANTTVKPIISSIFTFLTQTVIPKIVSVFAACAPTIANIIGNIGSAVMTVMGVIGQAIQTVLPIIEGIVGVILNIGGVVIPAVLGVFEVLTQGISEALAGVKQIFGGIIEFITGIFSGDWEKAWNGVKDIFGGIFDTLGALFKVPINAVINLINKAIGGINKLGLKIPDWVPILGGKDFRINIPEIPLLAKGGFTQGPSIAGEAGTEAVISFQKSQRAKNLAIWEKAGQMLGVRSRELPALGGEGFFGKNSGENSVQTITYAPQITIQGSADKGVVEEALSEAQRRFERWYEEMEKRKKRVAYG